MSFIQDFWESQWQNRGKPSIKWAKFFPFALVRAYLKEHIAEDAQSLVYVTILTLVPLLAVAVSLLHGFGIQDVIEPWLREFFSPLGEAGNEVSAYLLNFVGNTKASNLGIIGVVFLFISVMNIAQRIETALDQIWRVENSRSLRARLSGYFTTVLLAPLMIAALMSMMLGMKDATWLQPYLQYHSIEILFNLLTSALPISIVFILIACMYTWIPSRKVSFKAALVGAAFFLAAWYPVSWVFSRTIAVSTNYSAIYSSFASIIILLFWLQFLWLIFLLGAKVSSLVQIPHLLAPSSDDDWFADEQLKLGIALLAHIETQFQHAQPAPNMQDFTRLFAASPQKIQFILNRLLKANLITETNASPTAYLPSKAIHRYRLVEIYNALALPFDPYQQQYPHFQQLDCDIRILLNLPLVEWAQNTPKITEAKDLIAQDENLTEPPSHEKPDA